MGWEESEGKRVEAVMNQRREDRERE